ncbi:MULTISPECIES: aa3-type cytochrome oxidase subunit CtaJ [unclassified Blastococcus]
MSVVETILIFAVIPLAVVALFALLTLVPGRTKKARYKPGQAWEYPPVWWEPHPLHGPAAGSHDSGPKAIGSSVYQEPHGIESGAGSSAAAAARPVPVRSGPLGGARGTW